MKTLVTALTFSLISLAAFSQQGTTKATPKKVTTTATTATTYKCPVCGATATKAGDCSKDKIAMVKVGDYYCPDCYMSSSKAGKCSMCGVDMKKMEASTK